jgi:hypothetical protein
LSKFVVTAFWILNFLVLLFEQQLLNNPNKKE